MNPATPVPYNFRQGIRQVLAFEEPLAGDGLINDDAEGPDVGAPVDGLAASLFGDMYAAVPRIMPACVMCTDSVGEMVGFEPGVAAEFVSADLASPKSRTLTTPAGVSLIFVGFSNPGPICFLIGETELVPTVPHCG